MHSAARHAAAAVFVVLAASMLAGCGSDAPGSDSRGATTDEPAAGTSQVRQPAAGDGDADADSGSDVGGSDDVPPSAAAIAAGRGLRRLAIAYAPASARINFLVTAEALRNDAVDGNAGDRIERERSGVALIEAERMTDVLADVRPRVAAIAVRTIAQQEVRQLLLGSIDIRSRAMRELSIAIKAQRTGQGDSIVRDRFATWRDSWDESLRATREATTTTQEALAALGLEAAREDALR